MPDRDVFDFLGLPPELRVMIYEYAFCEADFTPTMLLSRRVPGLSLHYTCHFIHNESFDLYDACTTAFVTQQEELLSETLDDEIDLLEPDPNKMEPRTWALHRAILRLGQNSDDLPEGFGCEHSCANESSYMCTCEERNNCFNCGRWLALAIYHDLHPETQVLQLIDSNFHLTRFGNAVDSNTRKLTNAMCEHSQQIVCRYPAIAEAERFGEAWWRFELERQRWARVSEKAYELSKTERLKAEDLHDLLLWDKFLVRNGLEPPAWHAVEAMGRFPSLGTPLEDVVTMALGFAVLAGPAWLLWRFADYL